ncbi:hypothetical protein PGB90_004316 [Kerria lacca]
MFQLPFRLGFDLFHDMANFRRQYTCYSVSLLPGNEREDVEEGGKNITNPKAVLESNLRKFACLSKNDIIAIKYCGHVYELRVLETQPDDAVNIIECDMNVEFAPPLDYKDPQKEQKNEEEMVDLSKLIPVAQGFVPFSGESSRLDGKKKKEFEDESTSGKPVYKRGIPDYNYEVGTLQFFRHSKPVIQNDSAEIEDFTPFSGKGTKLRDSKKKVNIYDY